MEDVFKFDSELAKDEMDEDEEEEGKGDEEVEDANKKMSVSLEDLKVGVGSLFFINPKNRVFSRFSMHTKLKTWIFAHFRRKIGNLSQEIRFF